MHRSRWICITGAVCLALASSFAYAASFEGIEPLAAPGHLYLFSLATDVSSDGQVVIGIDVRLAVNESFRWTKSGGTVSLGNIGAPENGPSSEAIAVSGDGSVAVGYADSQAGIWTAATGWMRLGDLPGGQFDSIAYGVSRDGTIVVGEGRPAYGIREALIWSSATGFIPLGDLSGGSFESGAADISADGKTIVGYGRSEFGTEAFAWTLTTGMVGLGDLPGGVYSSSANDVSADGSVIVGGGSTSSGYQAVKWTTAGGIEPLGSEGIDSNALAVSDDGSTIVGSSLPGAFIWTEATGMVELKQYLLQLGATDVQDWHLIDANGISADGRVIVGSGLNPNGEHRAWVATIPEPSGLGLALALAMALCCARGLRRSR